MPKLRVNDIDLHYEISGQGQPILFIHGLGSSLRDWELQIPYFAKQYQVIAFDVRGHGGSDKPPGPYSIPQFAADAAGLVRALDLAPVHAVGISLGGMIAFQLVVDAPDLIRSLTVANAAPEFLVRTAKDRLQVLQRRLIVRLLGMRKMGEVLAKRLFIKPEQAEIRKIFADRWAENDPRAYSNAMNAIVGWSVADRLESIACPALVIAADEDYTPVSLKESFAAQMKRAQLAVIRDSRHATPVEHPDQFNETLAAFLSKHA